MDTRIKKLVAAIEALKGGGVFSQIDHLPDDEFMPLAQGITDLSHEFQRRYEISRTLEKIIEKVNLGITLEEILNYTYDSFRNIIPYDRIGFALLEEDGQILRCRWGRSEVEENMKIIPGYEASMEGSSLQTIIETGQPRILNDLEGYLKEHPGSESTRFVVEEGIRSSLTCPLIARGKNVGFMFFSSLKRETYKDIHVDLYLRIAGQISLIAEKGRLHDELVNLNDLKSKFLGIAAHELRSPLSILVGKIDLIIDGFLGSMSGKITAELRSMRDWCFQLLKIIDEFLDISAIDSGKLDLHKKNVDIVSFLKRITEFYSLLAQRKSMQLELSINGELPVVNMDENRIQQVLANLISNAIKFSPQKTTIVLAAQAQEEVVQFSVSDQGQGITEGEQKKLFEYFGKTKVKPTGDEKSSGIGLAISKRMIEAHGGKLWVQSNPGDGSTFLMSLPLK